MISKLLVSIIITTCLHSCILPVPHRRVHVPGASGQVVDAHNNKPIKGAKVYPQYGKTVLAVTNDEGRYNRKPVYGWHGAYLFGPVSYSLFPHFDMSHAMQAFWITADGYQKTQSVENGVTRLIPMSDKR